MRYNVIYLRIFVKRIYLIHKSIFVPGFYKIYIMERTPRANEISFILTWIMISMKNKIKIIMISILQFTFHRKEVQFCQLIKYRFQYCTYLLIHIKYRCMYEILGTLLSKFWGAKVKTVIAKTLNGVISQDESVIWGWVSIN